MAVDFFVDDVTDWDAIGAGADWREAVERAVGRADSRALALLVAAKPEGVGLDDLLCGEGHFSALHVASRIGFIPGCELLLMAGADADARDAYGCTARAGFGVGTAFPLKLGPFRIASSDPQGAEEAGRALFEAGATGGGPAPYSVRLGRAAKPGRAALAPAKPSLTYYLDAALRRGELPVVMWGDDLRGAVWLLPDEVEAFEAILGRALVAVECGAGVYAAEVAPHPVTAGAV